MNSVGHLLLAACIGLLYLCGRASHLIEMPDKAIATNLFASTLTLAGIVVAFLTTFLSILVTGVRGSMGLFLVRSGQFKQISNLIIRNVTNWVVAALALIVLLLTYREAPSITNDGLVSVWVTTMSFVFVQSYVVITNMSTILIESAQTGITEDEQEKRREESRQRLGGLRSPKASAH